MTEGFLDTDDLIPTFCFMYAQTAKWVKECNYMENE